MNQLFSGGITPQISSQWAGFVSLVLCFFCFWRASGSSGHVEAMEETPTSPASSVQKPGYYEVKGRAACDDPILIPDSDRTAVYYRHRIWEQTQEDFLDDEGLQRTRTVEKLVQDETEMVEFRVEDESGSMLVDPRGADIDSRLLVARQPQGVAPPTQIPEGDQEEPEVQEAVRLHEVVGILVGQDLFVLGSVQTRSAEGGLLFQENRQEERPYLISVRSEEEQTAQHRFFANFYNLGGLIFGFLATGLLSYGLGYL
jgi:hypothetical protein